MQKIVINTWDSGLFLSDKAFELYLEKKNIKYYKVMEEPHSRYYRIPKEEYNKLKRTEKNKNYLSQYDINRADPILIEIIEELGEDADSNWSNLKIVEIPDDVEWEIEEYDGVERVAEKHRTWD